jgi:hypothetical protein
VPSIGKYDAPQNSSTRFFIFAQGKFKRKPAISTTFWNTIYFYAASATAGNHLVNLSYDCARGSLEICLWSQINPSGYGRVARIGWRRAPFV